MFKADSPTFTGNVTVPADPQAATDAASKDYVDKGFGAMKRGKVTFNNEQQKAVAFAQAFADANYRVSLGPNGEATAWVSDKTANGFNINTSAAFTGDVDWFAYHD